MAIELINELSRKADCIWHEESVKLKGLWEHFKINLYWQKRLLFIASRMNNREHCRMEYSIMWLVKHTNEISVLYLLLEQHNQERRRPIVLCKIKIVWQLFSVKNCHSTIFLIFAGNNISRAFFCFTNVKSFLCHGLRTSLMCERWWTRNVNLE